MLRLSRMRSRRRLTRSCPLGLAFWGSMTLLSAVELGLFAVIGKAARMHAEELRQRLGVYLRSARDFLDALVALGMLARRRTVLKHCGDRTLPRPGKAVIRRRPVEMAASFLRLSMAA
jgi:Dimerisation domain